MKTQSYRHGLIAFFLLLIVSMTPAQAATITIINTDGPGEGFNDNSTNINPAPGNAGTTLGEQRLIAFQFAADLWESKLQSNVEILVEASFRDLNCGPTTAVLGAAVSNSSVANFPGAPRQNTFYPVALGNALSGNDLVPDNTDITAFFNGDVDNNDLCLRGFNWYYGLDNNPPANDLDFLTTATHELAHGLGFASIVNIATGEYPAGIPDIYAVNTRDLEQGLNWDEMTDNQRQASATNGPEVVWNGPSATANGAPTLNNGVNQGRIQLFTPATLQQGSSVSHWDTALTPNALMEPSETGDIAVNEGVGLATCQLQDIGWTLLGDTQCPDVVNQEPPPVASQCDFDAPGVNVIMGTENNDTLTGTNGPDVILGLGGDDTLDGRNGDDCIDGGMGVDVLMGRGGADELYGGDGNDDLRGGGGDDNLNGGTGDDTLQGNRGNDTLNGDAGVDFLSGQQDADTLNGGDGDDELFGGGGADTLNGDADNDLLNGGGGIDILNGGSGADRLFGLNENDTLNGDEGDDELTGNNGFDELNGGPGNDTLFGRNGNDTLNGNEGDDRLFGDDGNDTIEGGTGDDFISGNAGIDTCTDSDGVGTIRNCEN